MPPVLMLIQRTRAATCLWFVRRRLHQWSALPRPVAAAHTWRALTCTSRPEPQWLPPSRRLRRWRVVQHGEAAGAAGDLGGFDNFRDFLEGNEIGGAGGNADKDTDEDVDAVDLYGGWDDDAAPGLGGSDSGEDDGGIADGSAIKYEDFFGRSAPYRRAGGATDGRHKRHGEAVAEDKPAEPGAEQLSSGEEDADGSGAATAPGSCACTACMRSCCLL